MNSVEKGAVYRRLCADALQLHVRILLYADASALTALGVELADSIRVTSLIGYDDLDEAAERLAPLLIEARQG